jgi:hypothetical protein
MSRSWVTTASTNVQAMTNSLTAACDDGYVPDANHVLEMPNVAQHYRRVRLHSSVEITLQNRKWMIFRFTR